MLDINCKEKSHIPMARYLPPLNALRAFEAAGRHQSFSRSADELNVSHAAISRHVRGLEKRLGVQLFRNVARGVELTKAGRRYLDQITPALTTFHGFRDGRVFLKMRGACAGCPSSTATLQYGIQNLLKHFIPEVEAVEAVQ